MNKASMQLWAISFCVQISLYMHAQGVGIGTSTPQASAKLEVNSTSSGLLLPRMTFAQRNQIPAPAQALMVYCTDCGSVGEMQLYNGISWSNMMGGPALPVLSIGADYQGGLIAYVFQPGDPGYIPGYVHGLIAAVSDQSASIVWDDLPYILTGANGTVLGTGNANTNAIVTAQGAGTYAAKLCSDLALNGYSDWYLPSKDELNKLYLNRVAIGGFVNAYYWSSSEFDLNAAWLQNFTDGSQTPGSKFITAHVRAIRSF